MFVSCSLVRSATSLAGSTHTAIPSIATMFSATPAAFSSSFKLLEELPISAVPLVTASIPAPDPTNSAVTVTSGYSSMKASLNALANFSIEVLPTMEMLPDRSAVVSAEAASLLAATVLSAALLSTAEGCAVVASPLPHATNVVTANIPAPIRANNLLCLTLIIMSSMCLFFFLLITQSY